MPIDPKREPMRSRWWDGFMAGFTIALLLWGGMSLFLKYVGAEERVEGEIVFETRKIETVMCACDAGHEFEAEACGWKLYLYDKEYGPYCQMHIVEFVEATFPKVREVPDAD